MKKRLYLIQLFCLCLVLSVKAQCTLDTDSVKVTPASGFGTSDGACHFWPNSAGTSNFAKVSFNGGPFVKRGYGSRPVSIGGGMCEWTCVPDSGPCCPPPPFCVNELTDRLMCGLKSGKYKLVYTSFADTTCTDTLDFTIGGPPCWDFQWDLCFVSPTAKPAVWNRKVVYNTTYPGPSSVQVEILRPDNTPVPLLSYQKSVKPVGTFAPCGSGTAWTHSDLVLALPPGPHKTIFIQPGGTCRDTVPFTMPSYPCIFQLDSFLVTHPTTTTSSDGYIRFKGSDMDPKVKVYKNGTLLPANTAYIHCEYSCRPSPNDPPPVEPGCPDDASGFNKYGMVCRLKQGTYKIVVSYAYDSTCKDSMVVNLAPGGGEPDSVGRPAVSLPSGTYTGNQTVTLNSTTPGSNMYFTLNGNLPDIEKPNSYTKPYTGPLLLFQNTTLKTMAVKGSMKSPVVTRNYIITSPTIVANPVFSLPAGTYAGIQSLTITCATPGAVVWYSTNGTVPVPGTSISKIYTGPISIAQSMTVRAVGVLSGFVTSGTTAANYTITNVQTVAAPAFTPPPGVYATPQSITITCATPGAQILYTTNGMTPKFGLLAARTYSTPVNIPSTVQLKARAFVTGAIESAITVGNYSIGALRKAVSEDQLNYYFTSDEDPDLNAVLAAYPNPSHSGVFEIAGLDATSHIQIVNMVGQQVEYVSTRLENNNHRIDLSKQPSGLYLLKVTNPTGTKELRLVK